MRRSAAALEASALISAMLVLPACSTGGTAPESGGAGDPAKAEITYAGWTPEQGTFDEILAGFNADNPDIKVSSNLAPYDDYLTSLRTELSAGQGPDIFALEPGALLTQFKGFAVPVDQLADDSSWAEKYTDSALGGATVDGTVYGLPTGVNAAGFLWVNETLLEQDKVTIPTDYDQLVSAVATLEANGHVGVAYGGKDAWQNLDLFMSVANGIDSDALYKALDGNGSWQEPKLVESFAAYQRIFNDRVVQDGATGAATYMDAVNLFLDGKAAFYASGSWELGMTVADSTKDRMAKFSSTVIPFPTPSSDGSGYITADASSILVINKSSKNQAAAFKLAQYMSSGAGGQVLTDFFLDTPPIKDAPGPAGLSESAAETRKVLTSAIADQYAGYRQLRNVEVKEALSGALTQLMLGSMTAEQAAQTVQQASESA